MLSVQNPFPTSGSCQTLGDDSAHSTFMRITIQTFTGEDTDELDVWGIDPLWRETGEDGSERIISWVGFWR